jgi:hypothetical protein
MSMARKWILLFSFIDKHLKYFKPVIEILKIDVNICPTFNIKTVVISEALCAFKFLVIEISDCFVQIKGLLLKRKYNE